MAGHLQMIAYGGAFTTGSTALSPEAPSGNSTVLNFWNQNGFTADLSGSFAVSSGVVDASQTKKTAPDFFISNSQVTFWYRENATLDQGQYRPQDDSASPQIPLTVGFDLGKQSASKQRTFTASHPNQTVINGFPNKPSAYVAGTALSLGIGQSNISAKFTVVAPYSIPSSMMLNATGYMVDLSDDSCTLSALPGVDSQDGSSIVRSDDFAGLGTAGSVTPAIQNAGRRIASNKDRTQDGSPNGYGNGSSADHLPELKWIATFPVSKASTTSNEWFESVNRKVFAVVQNGKSVGLFIEGSDDIFEPVRPGKDDPNGSIKPVPDIDPDDQVATPGFEMLARDGTKYYLTAPDESVQGATGKVRRVVDPSGAVTTVTMPSASNSYKLTLTSTRTQGTLTSVATVERQYTGDPATGGRPTWMQLTVDSSILRHVSYSYNAGHQLEKVALRNGNSSAPVIGTEYYRWEGSGAESRPVMYLSSDSYLRALGALGSEFAITAATQSELKPYADAFFTYEQIPNSSLHRVASVVLQGAGCGCGGLGSGGQGLYKLNYFDNTSVGGGRNAWARKLTVTLPDKYPDSTTGDNTVTYYLNSWGKPILEVEKDGTTGREALTWTRYNDRGQVVMVASPSAVNGYSTTLPDLVGFDVSTGRATHISDSSGLVEVTEYYVAKANDPSANWLAGGVTVAPVAGLVGYAKATFVQIGDDKATQVKQQQWTYDDGGVANDGIFYVASHSRFMDVAGSQEAKTVYSRTFHSGAGLRLKELVVTEPLFGEAVNGPDTGTASSVVSTYVYDLFGNLVWTKDQDGYLTYHEHDLKTGSRTKTIVDVNPSSITSPVVTAPSRGSGLPAALDLTTVFDVDSFGRTRKLTDAVGRVTYVVYDDNAFDDGFTGTRTYSGWDASATRPTGPVLIQRTNRQLGYHESMELMWGTSVPTGAVTLGMPNGLEAVDAAGVTISSLSRRLFNVSGMTTDTDSYVTLAGTTYSTNAAFGSLGTNYFRSSIKYTGRGSVMAEVSANGTIRRNVYDGFNRLKSVWIGTNDSFTGGDARILENDPTGGGAPSNNMTGVVFYEYDDRTSGTNALAGNSNVVLSRTIRDPATGASTYRLSAYDDRNRLISTKTTDTTNAATESSSGQRPLLTYVYDNAGRVLTTRQYDGDGLSLTTAPATFQTGNAQSLRAYSTNEYDLYGRVFRSKTFAVDPANGSFSTSTYLANLTWFDRRGNVIKSAGPNGPVSKRVYDGAGRVTKTYVTDGGGDAAAGSAGSWADAGNVTGDVVLEQVEQGYDAASQVIATTRRQRFHDETGTGELGTATTGVKARVSYAGMYYDLAGRAVASVDVGSNGGTAWTRPTTAPTSSTSTLLLSTYTYDVLDSVTGFFGTEATDARGVKSRSFADLRGQTVRTIEAYTNGTPTADSNRITTYTYDGSGHVLAMKAYTTASAFQETKYIYGISPSNSSKISSNDVLFEVQYPDPTTGSASSASKENFAYDGSGARIVFTDRNGSVHSYAYDPVGRLASDSASNGTGVVDTTVRKLTYSYDSAGRLASTSTLDGTDTVLNTVTRTYNGFGSILSEVQPGGTVTYAYSTPSATANHSRLTSMTYGSRTVNYVYDSGLDNTISRISRLQDVALASSGGQVTLEGYQYLGLSTPVARTRPEAGGGLQLYKKSGEADGDAGDKYTGLDRFGRVRDQRWLDGSGNDADRFRYGYDTAGNPLFKENVVAPARSELYHNAGTSAESTGYDPLNRLKAFSRGTLSFSGSMATDITGTPIVSKNWSLDALGNWSQVTIGSNTATRTHDSQNRLTSTGSGPALTYDANGNQKTNERGEALTYDLWNRLIRVGNGSTLYSSYTYDALNRRISITTDTGGGKLDATFGGGSGYVINTSSPTDHGTAVAVQSDGKVVVVGHEDGKVLILRYTSSGVLDTTFNSTGKLVVNLGGGTTSRANAVAIDANGKIVIAGRTAGSGVVDALVARYNSNGTLDTSFDTDGVVTFDIAGSGYEEEATRLAIRDDGKILVLSKVIQTSSAKQNVAVTQLTTSGAIDSANFATSTSGHFRWGNEQEHGKGLALLPDGKLIVTGNTRVNSSTPWNGFALRVLTNGTLDTAASPNNFGTAGVSIFGGSDTEYFDGGVVIKVGSTRADDKIILAGSLIPSGGSQRNLVAQLTANGSLDTSFSGDGFVDFVIQTTSRAETVALQSDGRILIGSKIQQGSNSPDAAVLRINDNGTPDATFGVGGVTTYSLGFDDFAPGSAVFSASRLLIVGSAFNSGSFNTNTVALTLGGQGTTNLTYSAQWQVLVETPVVAVGGSFTETSRVWSPLYVDGLVGSDERLATVVDEGFDENGYWATYGYTLTARSFVRADANWNVTSLVRAGAATTPTWTTVERYEYDPYGSVTYLSGSFGVLTASSYGQKYLHQGGRLDEVAGLYSFRFREYDPVQGRWKQADPLHYIDGLSLYCALLASPIRFLDPSGTVILPGLPDITPPGNPATPPVQVGSNGAGENCMQYACGQVDELGYNRGPQQFSLNQALALGVISKQTMSDWSKHGNMMWEDLYANPTLLSRILDAFFGSAGMGGPNGPCNCNQRKVCAYVYRRPGDSEAPYDMHWIVQHADGTWSGKRGLREINWTTPADESKWKKFVGCWCLDKGEKPSPNIPKPIEKWMHESIILL